MSAPLFRGCGTALLTPFRNGKIDFLAFGRLISNGRTAAFPSLPAPAATIPGP